MGYLVHCSLVLALVTLASSFGPPAIAGSPSRGVMGDGEVGTGEAKVRLDELWKAVNARELPAILAAYDPDSAIQHDARTRFEGFIALDSLRCEGRIGSIATRGDTVEVIACERTSWSESGRPHADAFWRTYKLHRGGEKLRIVSDSERDYARARFTDLSVDLQPERGSVQGSARIEVGISDPGEDNLLLRLNRGLAVRTIEGSDGKAMSFSRCADLITVPLPAPARGGDVLTLTIEFEGTFYNESGEQGYSQVAISPAGSFASWVTNWYPHLQGIGSKSRGRITYSVPSDVTVASSGRPTEASTKDGRSRQVFEVRQPLDFSFAAAPYFHKTREIEGTTLGVYFLRGGDAKADLYLDSAARVLGFVKDFYGFYPFDGYSIVEIPSEEVGALGGSSEQGMNLFPVGGLPDDRFPLPLFAHEIGHSWWGNLVGGKDGPVIDEALAQMTAVLAVDKIEGTRAMRRFLVRGVTDYPQSALFYFSSWAGIAGKDLPLATQPASAAAVSLLHSLADLKGHFVYEMLRETVGEDAFRAGLRDAVTRYARKEIRLSDLRGIWERTSGRDLGWFFTEWFERSGAPEFHLSYAVTGASGGFDVAGKITQTGEPYTVLADLVFAGIGTSPRIEKIAVSGNETPFRFHLDRKPDAVLFDPDYKILRWTDSYRNLHLLMRENALRECGRTDRAIAILRDYLAKAPDDMAGRCDLGICYEDEGNLDLAEAQFRSVIERARIYDSDDPATARSELHLGHIADLRHRRNEAKDWYARALASFDDSNDAKLRAESEACLAAPYEPKPHSAADPAILARCPGTYAANPGLTLVISADDDSILSVSSEGQPALPLAPAGGSAFRLIGATEGTFEFGGGGGGGFADLTIQIFGREYHLKRQGGRGEGTQ